MIPELLQGDGSIMITVQGIEIAADPGDAPGFLPIQPTVAVAVGLTEILLEAWTCGG